MGLLEHEFLRKYVLFTFVLLGLLVGSAAGNVVLIGRNVSLSFPDVEANFARPIKRSGECGVLYVAEPLDACGPLTNQVGGGSENPFALIIRGGCTFDAKVRSAQNAGFKAAIVYDNEDSGVVISMSGNPVGIHIHAVFISKASGEIVKKYAGRAGLEFWIIPTIDNSAWSIMAISFISLLAMSAVLAMCFFVRRHRIRREQPQVPYIREFHGMSSRLVKAMPSLIFTSVLDDNCTSTTCAICLEDYTVGEKLRILPCRHKFHAFCVDCWLTSWRTFCPVCKQDARASIANLPASEGNKSISKPKLLLLNYYHKPCQQNHLNAGKIGDSFCMSRPLSYSFHLKDEARLFNVAVVHVTQSQVLTGFHSSRMAVKEQFSSLCEEYATVSS